MAQTGIELAAVLENNHQSQQQEINNIQMTKQTGEQLASIDEQKPLSTHLQQQINIPISSHANVNIRPPQPKLPSSDLLNGSRENYLKIGVPLYGASIKCDWKAAKAIFDKYPDMKLERCSITENGETALHVASSAKGSKVEEFVKNLVAKMERDDLELQNNNHNTALYLAAAAGNIKAVKIMFDKNNTLLNIAGSNGTMMPLYTAVLFGNVDMVKYLYNHSKELRDDGWTPTNRGWLLEKCVENDMFDVALVILKLYPELGTTTGNVLGVLARKPKAFPETTANFISRTVNRARHICSKILTTHQPSQNAHPEVGSGIGPFPETNSNIFKRIINSAPERKNALPLLRFIWEEIAKKRRKEIDNILRGPPDLIRQDIKTVSGWAIAMQLKKLISEHVAGVNAETNNIITTNPDPAKQLQNLISERLLNIQAETQKIIKGAPNSIMQKVVSSKGDQALELQNLIVEHITNVHYKSQKIIKQIPMEDQVWRLKKVIFEHIEKLDNDTKKILVDLRPAKETYSSRVLFIAAEMGNTNFLVELIRLYPDLIWKVNDDNQSIFHIAVKHRHEGIYNLLFEIGAMKDLITPLKDPKNNNMLHLVGTIAKQKRLEDVSGVALQMQRELLWFQEVENMIPLSYKEKVNNDGFTPHELFTKEHKNLVTQGEKWMKGTANQCMVVAALIATIVFAAAFTVPGGYDQTNGKTNGIPVFHSKATFMVFVVADAISLFLSCASILIFLSILTSRYAEGDFLESVPKKLISGLLTLFLSITTMTVAFGVSFFVLYHEGLLWMPILICVFALLPVLLYMWLQYSLFSDVIRSTYRSRYLFKPHKHVLCYENPKV